MIPVSLYIERTRVRGRFAQHRSFTVLGQPSYPSCNLPGQIAAQITVLATVTENTVAHWSRESCTWKNCYKEEKRQHEDTPR